MILAVFGGMAAMIWMSVHTNQKKHTEKNGARMQHTYQQMQTSKGRYDKWMEGQKADIRLEEGKEKKRENGIWRNI